MFKRYCLLPVLVLVFMLGGCSKEEVRKLELGDKAPVFSLQDLDGNKIRLADMAGSPVLMRFFLTDCKYCRADTPVFNEFYAKYHDQGLQVFYIDSLGIDPNVLKSFVKELDIQFPVARDTESKVTSAYMVRALPQTIVLDPDHRIIAAILGGVSEPELTQLLSPFLPKL